MYETIQFEERGELAVLRIVRPRINVRQLKELERVLDHLEDASQAKVLVLRLKSEGMDFADFDPKEPLDIHGFNKWEKLLGRLERVEKATVAVAEGDCAGGGFQLLLACDLRWAVPEARFTLPEVQLGFLPGMATWRLSRYVGIGHARRIALTGAALDTATAMTFGLLDGVEADPDVAQARALAAFGPTHVVAITLTRRLLLESFDTGYEDALGNFLAAQHRAISQSAFLETLRKERAR